MNTKNRREIIQGEILDKGFTNDFRYVHQKRIQRMKKVNFESTDLMGYIYGFRILNIGLTDLTRY